jgi:hypothetical protein
VYPNAPTEPRVNSVATRSAALCLLEEEASALPDAGAASLAEGDAASLMGRDTASLIDIADLSPLLNPLHRSSIGPGEEPS